MYPKSVSLLSGFWCWPSTCSPPVSVSCGVMSPPTIAGGTDVCWEVKVFPGVHIFACSTHDVAAD